MIFEPLTAADIAAALAIEQGANVYPWPQSAFNSSFGYGYFSFKLLNADRQFVGFYIAKLIADQLELFNICIAKTEQGKGYGRALLQHFLSEGRRRGAADILLEVRGTNHSAIALYQSNGFAVNGLREGYYVGAAGKEDALLMHCSLR